MSTGGSAGGYRYSEWEGEPGFDLDAGRLMDELGRYLMSHGDLSNALRLVQNGGIRDDRGRWLPSLQELLQQLRQRRQGQLQKYRLSSVLDEIARRVDEVLSMERRGIQRRLDEAAAGGAGLEADVQQRLLEALQRRAARSRERLDALPPDIGGRMRELTRYDFMDHDARRQFRELVDMLRKNAAASYVRDLAQGVQKMDARALADIRHMVEALNQMLEQRMKGEEPDFEEFMERFGGYFGADRPETLDDLMEQLRRRMSEAESLLNSLSPEDRRALEEALDSALDRGTQYELAKLSANLDSLHPGDAGRRSYPFSGEESISYTEALKVMGMLQNMDRLETQLREAQYRRTVDEVDEQLVREMMGDDAARDLDKLRNIARVLEDAGYIRWKDSRYELTPRGMRRIGQRALQDIYARLKRDRVGEHNLKGRGAGLEKTYETRRYQPGDDFLVDLRQTIMNCLQREPGRRPLRLSVEDFEVFRSEPVTRCATVLMLDLSLSMPMRGNFETAKRVAIALDTLIRSQYPKDTLYIVGFSSYARRIKKEDLSSMSWDQFDPYTNIQHGLYVARKLLSRETCLNKEVIVVTDGEPTAHIESSNVVCQYPPSPRTIQLTLREVKSCTRSGIVINTFMLGSGTFLSAFVSRMARINRGRVFFTSPDNLGQYVLVDYLSSKRKRI